MGECRNCDGKGYYVVDASTANESVQDTRECEECSGTGEEYTYDELHTRVAALRGSLESATRERACRPSALGADESGVSHDRPRRGRPLAKARETMERERDEARADHARITTEWWTSQRECGELRNTIERLTRERDAAQTQCEERMRQILDVGKASSDLAFALLADILGVPAGSDIAGAAMRVVRERNELRAALADRDARLGRVHAALLACISWGDTPHAVRAALDGWRPFDAK